MLAKVRSMVFNLINNLKTKTNKQTKKNIHQDGFGNLKNRQMNKLITK